MIAQVTSGKIYNAVAVTGVNNYYSGSTTVGASPVPSDPIGTDVNGALSIAVIGVFTGTPTGTMIIQASNSSDQDILLGRDVWDTADDYNGGGFVSGVATVTSGTINGGSIFKIKGSWRYRRLRLFYQNASGSGTLSATLTVKEV